MGNSEKNNKEITYNDVFDFYFMKRDCKPIIPKGPNGDVIAEQEAAKELDETLKRFEKDTEKINEIDWLEVLGLYIVAYGQKEGAYISLMKTCKELVNRDIMFDSCRREDDKFVFYVKDVTNNSQIIVNSLNKFTVEEISDWVLLDKEVVENNYNQAWHLLVSYIMYQELNGKYHFSKVGKIENLSGEFKYYCSSHCEELILWMAIVAGSDSCKIYEAFKDVVNFEHMKKDTEKKVDACDKIRKHLPWEIIKEKICIDNKR